MPLANKPLNEITEADLQELIDSQTMERKNYDYKQASWGNGNEDKKEFLADISSFANTVGGYIFVGMSEEGGIPTAITGLTGNVDAEKNRLENIIRDGIAPRIQGINMEVTRTGGVLIIQIPQSWSAPHMVKFAGSSKFFARNSGGKYQLDVDEIRSAFSLSESVPERIRNFRFDRVAKISAEATTIKLREGAKLVLHVIPMRAFTARPEFDLPTGRNEVGRLMGEFHDIMSVNNFRHNLDGLFLYGAAPDEERGQRYIQFFRNGAVEIVDTWILQGEEKIIPGTLLEKTFIDLLPVCFSFQAQLGIQPPIIVMVTLLDVNEYKMASSGRDPFWLQDLKVDRDELLIPDISIQNFDDDTGQTLKPVFDAIWNSCGWPQSMNYDKDGYWNPRRR